MEFRNFVHGDQGIVGNADNLNIRIHLQGVGDGLANERRVVNHQDSDFSGHGE